MTHLAVQVIFLVALVLPQTTQSAETGAQSSCSTKFCSQACLWRGSCKSGGNINEQLCSAHGGVWCGSQMPSTKPPPGGSTMTVHIINSKGECGESTFPTAWKASALKWVASQHLKAQVGLCSEAGYTEYSGKQQKLGSTGAPKAVEVDIYTKPEHKTSGLHFEAFRYPGGRYGKQTLKSWGSPLYTNWHGMRPFIVHSEHQKDVWYSNDKDFVREIPKFSKTDYFVMRWCGWLKSDNAGLWQFRTNSDDGSRLYIDNKLIVDNDGLHGMTAKQGLANLKRGWHKLVIVFFEKNGGAGLQVSVGVPQGKSGGRRHWQKLTAAMTKPGKDALMAGSEPVKPGKAPADNAAAAGDHLWFYTINKQLHRCGQVDAATRMPADMFRRGSKSNRYLKYYISYTQRYYRVPGCRGCKLRQGTCAQHGYTHTAANHGPEAEGKPRGKAASWPLRNQKLYFCRSKRTCQRHGTCALCDKAHNQPAFVQFSYKNGGH